MNNKRPIDMEIKAGEPAYTPFMPIVRYALDHGCRFVDGSLGRPFLSTPNGLRVSFRALLDRLTHHVNILEMSGDSYCLSQSKARKR